MPARQRSRLPGWLMWPGFALAAIIGAFVDPDFGLNPMSIRVVLTLFSSFVLFNLATWAIVRVDRPPNPARLRAATCGSAGARWCSSSWPWSSRGCCSEPGIIFGLVAGVAYGDRLQASRSAIIALVGSGFGLALALVAVGGVQPARPGRRGTRRDRSRSSSAREFLAGVTIKGVSTLPLSLCCRSVRSTAPR